MAVTLDVDFMVNATVELCCVPSPTGYTHLAAATLAGMLDGLGIPYLTTVKGSIVAELPSKGKGPGRMLSAHIDTLGVMVREIKSNGRLKLSMIGGYDWSTIEGEYCLVHRSNDDPVSGTILTTKSSYHVHGPALVDLKREADSIEVRLDELAESDEDVRKLGIEVGDFVSLDARTTVTDSGFIKSRHIDDKACVAICLGVAQSVMESGAKLPAPTYLYFSVFEDATAGVARALDLDPRQTLMALGLAGSRAGSISINTGTMTKSSHSGHAARMGVECAVLSKMGWTASADVFGPKGFFDTFLGGRAEPQLLVEGFAQPLRMVDPGVGFKKHPSNYFTHRGIDAALALREEDGVDPQAIESVEVIFPRFDYVNRPVPETGLDGKFSVQYTTAVALLDGEVTVDSFTNERRFSSDVQALLPRVALQVDDAIPTDFDRMHVIVSVRLSNGERHSKRVDRLSGWIGAPLTREQRLKKYDSCVRRVIEPKAADRVVELVEKLDELHDVREIMDIVRNER